MRTRCTHHNPVLFSLESSIFHFKVLKNSDSALSTCGREETACGRRSEQDGQRGVQLLGRAAVVGRNSKGFLIVRAKHARIACPRKGARATAAGLRVGGNAVRAPATAPPTREKRRSKRARTRPLDINDKENYHNIRN